MKVLLVSEYFPPKVFGGGEISAYLLAKNLAKKGIDVSVLTSRSEGLKEFEVKDKIKIYRRLRTGKNPISLVENFKRSAFFSCSVKKELRKLDAEENFDVMHFLNTTSIPNFKVNKKTIATINSYTPFCPKGNLFYKEKEVCSGCSPIKFVGCILSSEYFGKMKMCFYLKYNPFFWLYSYMTYLKRRNSLKNVDKFIAVSSFVKEVLKKEGFDSVVIPNLMEVNKKGPKYTLNKKGVVITYIGALEKIKGVEILITAFNEIKAKNTELVIVGSGSEEDKLKKIANKNIRFLGSLDYKYMPSIYKQSDLIILPSMWPEPLSRVLIEASYFGKPVIATNVGGNTDGVSEGKNGFLVNAGVDDIKERLEKLINGPKLCRIMGERARKLYTERFDKDSAIRKIIIPIGAK